MYARGRMAWQGGAETLVARLMLAIEPLPLQAVGRTHTTGYQENREVNNLYIMSFMTLDTGQAPE